MGLAAEPKKLLSEKIVYCQAALYGRQIFARFYFLESLGYLKIQRKWDSFLHFR